MQKINLVLLATALLASTALSSCTKEEIKKQHKQVQIGLSLAVLPGVVIS